MTTDERLEYLEKQVSVLGEAYAAQIEINLTLINTCRELAKGVRDLADVAQMHREHIFS